jgi:tetratricopeptide (TPR) repeat protein
VSSGIVQDDTAPRRYETCADAEGQKALDEALVHLQAGHSQLALPLLRTVVERCPEHVPAHCLYQDTALAVGGAAEASMRSYYSAMPAIGSVVNSYVKARLLDSTWARKEALERIVRRDVNFYFAHLSLGRLLRTTNRLSDAVDSFRRALAGNGNLLAAHLELAETLVDWGRYAEAVTHYQNYLRGAPSDLAAARAYVQLLIYRLGRPDAAMPWIDRLLERDPGDEAVMMDKAAAFWRANKPEQALAIYLQVLERRPDQARAVLNVAFLHYDQLAHDDATKMAHWRKAGRAFLMFLRLVRPEEGMDYMEQLLAVPYRLNVIDTWLTGHGEGPVDDGTVPRLAELK